MKWILFYQTPYDRVNFITDESQDRTSLSYKKFCDSLSKYRIIDAGNLQIELDTFHTVFLDIESGIWRREIIKNDTVPTFDDMVKLNPNEEDKKKQDVEKKSREVSLTKNYFDKKWEDKKGELFKGYGSR